jgi:hypothetical protein
MRAVVELLIDRVYRGPDDSANGGYACGRIAALAGEPVEVTLRRPPPLGVPLRVEDGLVTDGDALVAEYRAGDVQLEVPPAPAWEDAVEAQRPDVGSPFPHCFVCGVRRAPDEGLHIHAGPVGATPLVAAPWVPRPDTAGSEFVWCALDCPGAYACDLGSRGTLLLGRLAARVLRTPRPGERCVAAGWQLGAEGRKLEAGTALWSDGELLGYARATWIEPRPTAAA